MTFDLKDYKTVHVLAAVNDIKIIVKIQPHHLPEALGANESTTIEAARGTEGMATPEGSGGERAFSRAPS